MANGQQKQKRRRPPYASETDLDAFFGRIATVADPGKVDTAWVKSFGWAKAQPEAIVSVLKWLRIIDDKGKSLGVWDEVRVVATRQAKLVDLIRSAYDGVFTRVDVAQATTQDLNGAFVQAYQSGDPRRHITCFLALCKHAGIGTLAVATQSPPAPAGATTSGGAQRNPTGKRRAGKGSANGPGQDRTPKRGQPGSVTISVNVEIPADWSEEQIRERLETVRRVTQQE